MGEQELLLCKIRNVRQRSGIPNLGAPKVEMQLIAKTRETCSKTLLLRSLRNLPLQTTCSSENQA